MYVIIFLSKVLQIDSRIDRQIVGYIDRQLVTQIDSWIHRQIVGQIDRQVYRQIVGQIERQLDTQIDSRLDRQIVGFIYRQDHIFYIFSSLIGWIDDQLDKQTHMYIMDALHIYFLNWIYGQIDSMKTHVCCTYFYPKFNRQIDDQWNRQIIHMLYIFSSLIVKWDRQII